MASGRQTSFFGGGDDGGFDEKSDGGESDFFEVRCATPFDEDRLSAAAVEIEDERENDVAVDPDASRFHGLEQIIGSCTTKCPMTEAELNKTRSYLFETTDESPADYDPPKLVKTYPRSEAGKTVDPTTIRTPRALYETCMYLLKAVLHQEGAVKDWKDRRGKKKRLIRLVDIFRFVGDRFRGVRNDFTIQSHTSLWSVRCLEWTVRFHIMTGHLLCRHDLDSGFDPKYNRNMLDDSLTDILWRYYPIFREKYYESTAGRPVQGVPALRFLAEFAAYRLLYRELRQHDDHKKWKETTQSSAPMAAKWPGTRTRAADTELKALSVMPEVLEDPLVLFAMKTLGCYASDDWHGFFRQVRRAPYLQACLMANVFPFVRVTYLTQIWRSTVKSQAIELSWLRDELLFDSTEDVVSFVTTLGFRPTDGTLVKSGDGYDLPQTGSCDPWDLRFSSAVVESRRNHRSHVAVCTAEGEVWPDQGVKAPAAKRFVAPVAKLAASKRGATPARTEQLQQRQLQQQPPAVEAVFEPLAPEEPEVAERAHSDRPASAAAGGGSSGSMSSASEEPGRQPSATPSASTGRESKAAEDSHPPPAVFFPSNPSAAFSSAPAFPAAAPATDGSRPRLVSESPGTACTTPQAKSKIIPMPPPQLDTPMLREGAGFDDMSDDDTAAVPPPPDYSAVIFEEQSARDACSADEAATRQAISRRMEGAERQVRVLSRFYATDGMKKLLRPTRAMLRKSIQAYRPPPTLAHAPGVRPPDEGFTESLFAMRSHGDAGPLLAALSAECKPRDGACRVLLCGENATVADRFCRDETWQLLGGAAFDDASVTEYQSAGGGRVAIQRWKADGGIKDRGCAFADVLVLPVSGRTADEAAMLAVYYAGSAVATQTAHGLCLLSGVLVLHFGAPEVSSGELAQCCDAVFAEHGLGFVPVAAVSVCESFTEEDIIVSWRAVTRRPCYVATKVPLTALFCDAANALRTLPGGGGVSLLHRLTQIPVPDDATPEEAMFRFIRRVCNDVICAVSDALDEAGIRVHDPRMLERVEDSVELMWERGADDDYDSLPSPEPASAAVVRLCALDDAPDPQPRKPSKTDLPGTPSEALRRIEEAAHHAFKATPSASRARHLSIADRLSTVVRAAVGELSRGCDAPGLLLRLATCVLMGSAEAGSSVMLSCPMFILPSLRAMVERRVHELGILAAPPLLESFSYEASAPEAESRGYTLTTSLHRMLSPPPAPPRAKAPPVAERPRVLDPRLEAVRRAIGSVSFAPPAAAVCEPAPHAADRALPGSIAERLRNLARDVAGGGGGGKAASRAPAPGDGEPWLPPDDDIECLIVEAAGSPRKRGCGVAFGDPIIAASSRKDIDMYAEELLVYMQSRKRLKRGGDAPANSPEA
ncbi:Protein xmas-2 [Diplonema papillatum]|nr:Protein xmas-2 [Diplonema papillatum]